MDYFISCGYQTGMVLFSSTIGTTILNNGGSQIPLLEQVIWDLRLSQVYMTIQDQFSRTIILK